MMALDPASPVDVIARPLRVREASPLQGTLVRRALRMPLFSKLLLANAGILVLFGAGAALVTARTVRIGVLPPVAAIEVLLVIGLAASALANAVLIRLALSPLASLEEAARRVQQGDAAARAPESPLADEALRRVIRLFNQVLDRAEAERVRRTQLSLRVLQAEERERERLGRALYASTAQTLAGSLVRMRLLKRRGADEGSDALKDIRTEIAAALEEVQRMARRLHPPELADLGVLAALEAHARHATADRSIRATFEGRIPEDRLPEGAPLVLYRIVQEALSNAVLHSGGRSVHTRFESTGQGFVTEVVDDGHGFNPERTLLSGEGGLGILGMRERAGYVSGSLSVDSGNGTGTRVRLCIPWKDLCSDSRDQSAVAL